MTSIVPVPQTAADSGVLVELVEFGPLGDPNLAAVADSLETADHLGRLAWEVVATRRTGLDRAVTREPFLQLHDALSIATGGLRATMRIGASGRGGARRLVVQAVVVGVGGAAVREQVEGVGVVARAAFGGRSSPFVVRFRPFADMAWPTSGHPVFIRQPLVGLGRGGEVDAPCRFTWPGPLAQVHLLDLLMSTDADLDVFVSVSPTVAREDERERLQAAHDRLAEPADDGAVRQDGRDRATALDALGSFRTDVSVIQILVVGSDPVPEALAAGVARAFTSSFDTETHAGSRIVARPDRFVGGGFDLDPPRRPDDVLRRISMGLPYLGIDERAVNDLVTATEVGFSFGWPTDLDGTLPGHPVGQVPSDAPAPGADDVAIGTDALGRPVSWPS